MDYVVENCYCKPLMLTIVDRNSIVLIMGMYDGRCLNNEAIIT